MAAGVGRSTRPSSCRMPTAKIRLPSAQAAESWEIEPGVADTLLRPSSLEPTSGRVTRGAAFGSPYSQWAKTSQVPRPASLLKKTTRRSGPPTSFQFFTFPLKPPHLGLGQGAHASLPDVGGDDERDAVQADARGHE